jgi:hypothetical protein
MQQGLQKKESRTASSRQLLALELAQGIYKIPVLVQGRAKLDVFGNPTIVLYKYDTDGWYEPCRRGSRFGFLV